ncbi:MAG: sugar transferase [Opitutales bacterium]|nr:sugar transferase [Opitutales bacterium]
MPTNDLKSNTSNSIDYERIESQSVFRKESRERLLLRFSLIAVLGDVLAGFSAMILAWLFRFIVLHPSKAEVPFEISFIKYYAPQFLLGMIVLLIMLSHFKLYSPRFLLGFRRNLVRILQVMFYWSLGFLSISLMLKVDPEVSRGFVIVSSFTISASLIFWRWVYALLLANSSNVYLFKKRVLAVGWNRTAQELYEKVYGDPLHPISIFSTVSTSNGQFEEQPPSEVSVDGKFTEIGELLTTRKFDAVLLVDFDLSSEQILSLQQLCMREMTEFMAIPSFYQVLLSRLEFDSIGGVPVMTGYNLPIEHPFNQLLKRTIDIAGGLAGLILFFPLIAYFCFRVKKESPGPAFYKQTRTGKNGKPFDIVKIRSMKLDAEIENGAQWAQENDPRRLKIGEFIREHNIDELPQFWNVLKGDMSLVGPRPERPELIKSFKYDIQNYNLRHTVKPGVTGWAAVNGWRGDTDLQTRIAFDIEYMEKWSIWFDLYIMLKTFSANKNAY